jgi:hypothetical protein
MNGSLFCVQDYHWQTAGRILDETTLCNRFQISNGLHSQNTDRPWIRTINPEKIAKNACISRLFLLNLNTEGITLIWKRFNYPAD